MSTAGNTGRASHSGYVRLADTSPVNTEDHVVYHPVKTWKGYIWDTWELPPDQRRLLFKVDIFILAFASMGYFLKNLDQTNINNAFLSGMQEDLEMYENQLVTSTSIWTLGYIIGQIPSNLLLTRVSPRWIIPSLEVGWGIATVCTSVVGSYQSLYVLRFFVGLFEYVAANAVDQSGFYPGIHYLLGSWYTPREIGKRAMIFWLAGSVGTMFSGVLQGAAYTNLNGVYGRAGWRWLFIIDGIITIPLAVAGYFFFPNLPQDSKRTWWITEEEHALSVKRMRGIGHAGKQPWTKDRVKNTLSSWHIYHLPLLYILWNNGNPQVAMGYWLKSFNDQPPPVPGTSFTIPEINTLPILSTAIFLVMSLSWGWLSDGPLQGSRWPFLYVGATLTITFNLLLLNMPLYSNVGGRMIVYWLSSIGHGAGPLILSWINQILFADTEKRALIVAVANDLAYVVQATLPNIMWKTSDFPGARRGYTYSTILQVLLIMETAVIQFLLWRDRQKSLRYRDAESSPPTIYSDEGIDERGTTGGLHCTDGE